MRIRAKEIRRARRRQVERWKTTHKGAVVGPGGPAASAAAVGRPAPAKAPATGAARPRRTAGAAAEG